MRVLVVNPCARPNPRGFSGWNFAVAMNVAALKAAHHDVHVINPTQYDETELKRAHSDAQPRFIVIHTESLQSDQARAIGAYYGLNFTKSPVFFTGPHASAWPADCMNVAKGVFAIRGYADHILPQLCETIDKDGEFFNLAGLSFPVMNRFYHNPVERGPELSERPRPDRDSTHYAALMEGLESSVGAEIVTSRGEYHISDRSQAVFDMSSPQTGVLPEFQQATCQQVFAEARSLRDNGAKFLGLRDDSCLANALWVKEFCSQWRMQVGLPFWVAARPEFLKESVFEMLAAAGCYRVHLVVEAGADHVRRRVLGRRVSDTQLMYAARACRRFQMSLITISEIGFPGETEDMVRATIDLNRQMKPDWALCSVFHPVPGSAIFQKAEAKKWLSKSNYGFFYDPETRVEQPWIRGKKVKQYLEAFNSMVYGPKVIPGRRTRA